MHIVPAPAESLMKSRVLSIPGLQGVMDKGSAAFQTFRPCNLVNWNNPWKNQIVLTLEIWFPRLIVVPVYSQEVAGVRKEKERLTAAADSFSFIRTRAATLS